MSPQSQLLSKDLRLENRQCNFAKHGDPKDVNAVSTLLQWPAFTSPNSQAMYIGDNIAPGTVPFRNALDFYDSFYSRMPGRPS
jgi:para-nitrobenzyl esterase